MFQLVSMVILFSTTEEEEAQELTNLKKHIMVTIQRKIQASHQRDDGQMEIDDDLYNGSENFLDLFFSAPSPAFSCSL